MNLINKLLYKLSNRAEKPRYTANPIGRSVVITQSCVNSLHGLLKPTIDIGHEGVLYLGGLVSQQTSLIAVAYAVNATTTPGSFDVSPSDMAKVIRQASDYGLHVVGQLHTHPRLAYHSEGDDEGAHISFPGYVSIVLPDYGRHLPSMKGSANYYCSDNGKFEEINATNFTVLPDLPS